MVGCVLGQGVESEAAAPSRPCAFSYRPVRVCMRALIPFSLLLPFLLLSDQRTVSIG